MLAFFALLHRRLPSIKTRILSPSPADAGLYHTENVPNPFIGTERSATGSEGFRHRPDRRTTGTLKKQE
jgi:hypothetical protein